MNKPVKTLLERCGTRQEILADVRSHYPDTDLFAVHRWRQRDSVPGKYWSLIVTGAAGRGQDVSVDDFARAHVQAEDAA